jgi:uncharacterized UBP type Zn finger protein
MATCAHLADRKPVAPRPRYCEDCLKTGDRWVHLRQCLECGHVACCDSSPRRHATAHYTRTGHPLMRSCEPGEAWGWCYADDAMISFEDPAGPFVVDKS